RERKTDQQEQESEQARLMPEKIGTGAIDRPEQPIELAAIGTAPGKGANVGHDHDHATSAQDENDDQLTHDSNTLWISKSATRSRGPSAVALGCSSESKCNPPVVSSAMLPPSQGRPLELGQRPLESQRRSTIDEPTPIEA